MIKYIGWFDSFEPVGEGRQHYHNIVLELADFDLYEAIHEHGPPISSEDIHGFWESMFEISSTLAAIHTVTIQPFRFLTWHGDIKPENILRANDRFKLADPGEASMLLEFSDTSTLPQSKWTGGTRTYAAPEKAAYFDEETQKIFKITPKSDVWSFGCVLSIAATYVVLGKQGFLVYNELRRQSIYLGTEQMNDAFHDGKEVLQSVINWHKYLREAARKTDPFTSEVLDMVDNHMLVASETRWDAKMVRDGFEKILDRVKMLDSQVPLQLLSLIQNIDLEAERHYNQHSGFTRVETDGVQTRLKSISIPPPQVEFESHAALLNQQIQPAAQRSRKANESPSQTPSLAHSIPQTKGPEEPSMSASGEHVHAELHRRETMMSSVSQSTPGHRASPSLEYGHSVMKVGQVKQMLKTNGLIHKPQATSLSTLFKKQKTAVKRPKSGNNEAWEYYDKRLEEEFKDRDIVFLADNGHTMHTWWTQATELLEVLVWRALGFDDDGMELYFTDPDTNAKAIINSNKAKVYKQAVDKYTNAMELAMPAESGPRSCATTILPELERIINEYARTKASKRKPRKKTIIVLTDGKWLGMHDEYTLDVYLRSAFHGLKDLHGDLQYFEDNQSQSRQDISKVRPVTIQFVQFGDDPWASERLRRLDDDMKYYGCP
ncbi:hypothetical protein K4K56_005762 [Colletotrichum sp. SAR 10_98]|nr:hypothetical protein K4K56_005762 [Colletotrichum sp. SAR 10_98]